MRLAGLLAACVVLAGCAGFEQVTASRRDYYLYRETRVADSAEGRLASASRYLREMPDGHFRGPVEDWFRGAEPRFYGLAHDRPSLLRAYLRALPDGPHANEARMRLDEFDQLNRMRTRRVSASEQNIDRITGDLSQAEAGRRALLAEFGQLSRLIASTKSFGQPTSELDHELIYRLRLLPPTGICDASLCRKSYVLAYGVPYAGKIAPREARFELRVGLEQGAVASVALAGEGLFNQLGEAVDKTVVEPTDLQGRAESIGRATMLVENAIESSLPSAECRKDVVAPVVLARRCRGVALSMIAAGEPGEADRLEIRAASGESRAP